MVLYTCISCKKEFIKKDNYIKHTEQRKKLCRIITIEPQIPPAQINLARKIIKNPPCTYLITMNLISTQQLKM